MTGGFDRTEETREHGRKRRRTVRKSPGEEGISAESDNFSTQKKIRGKGERGADHRNCSEDEGRKSLNPSTEGAHPRWGKVIEDASARGTLKEIGKEQEGKRLNRSQQVPSEGKGGSGKAGLNRQGLRLKGREREVQGHGKIIPRGNAEKECQSRKKSSGWEARSEGGKALNFLFHDRGKGTVEGRGGAIQ